MSEIITIADGECIPGPGAYRMSLAHYHSQACCPGPSISSSGIRKIVNESPWHFWMSSEMNPDRYPESEPSDALILGRAAHSLILGDEVFEENFIFVPKDAPRRPTVTQINAFERDGKWSAAAEAGALFWEAFDARAAARQMVSESQIETIQRMAENLKKNPLAVEMLTGGMTEISMIWQDEATGVWIKSRPDVIPDNGADFADLKTFAPRTKSIKRAVHQAITDNAYQIQMALAVMAAREVFGTDASDCVLVMTQTNAPYTVTPVRLDAECLYLGEVMCRHGIDTFARCLGTGIWPQPVEGVLDFSLPPSFAQRLYEMQAAGELPQLERSAA